MAHALPREPPRAPSSWTELDVAAPLRDAGVQRWTLDALAGGVRRPLGAPRRRAGGGRASHAALAAPSAVRARLARRRAAGPRRRLPASRSPRRAAQAAGGLAQRRLGARGVPRLRRPRPDRRVRGRAREAVRPGPRASDGVHVRRGAVVALSPAPDRRPADRAGVVGLSHRRRRDPRQACAAGVRDRRGGRDGPLSARAGRPPLSSAYGGCWVPAHWPLASDASGEGTAATDRRRSPPVRR